VNFRKVLFFVAILALGTPYLRAASSILVHGPVVFTVHSGAPTTESISFALPALVYGPFTLQAEHQDLTGVNVELNGIRIFGSETFDSQPLRSRVSLQAVNSLRVGLTGREGATLTIRITGYEYPFASRYVDLPLAPAIATTGLVSEVDWRRKGAVTPVKNQGDCGASWAFSATGAVEGLVAIMRKPLPNLSEQQLIDCSRDGNVGCNGGSPAAAFTYIAESGGLAATSDYPYRARSGQCKRANPVAHITGFFRLPPSEEVLQAHVADQPVSAIIRAGTWLQTYRGGVANPNCNGYPRVYQDVLVVGYGHDTQTDQLYWIIKNSWGTSWGSSGYLYLIRDGKDTCGIADFATIPLD